MNNSEIYALMARSSELRAEWARLDAELRTMKALGWEGLPNEAELDARYASGALRRAELEKHMQVAGAEFRAALAKEFEPNTPFKEPKTQSQKDYINLYSAGHLFRPRGDEAAE